MAGLSGSRLTRGERLGTAGQYRRVFHRGLRLDGPLFSLVAAPNDCGHDRLGLAASRKVGGAVARNRAKRLLRECFRRFKRPAPPALDLILVAKKEILACSQAEVDSEYRERIRRLESRTARAFRAAPPAAH